MIEVISLDMSQMFEEWKETFLHPGTTFPKMVKTANLGGGLQHLAVGYVVYAILSFIAAIIVGTLIGGAAGLALGASLGIMGAIVMIIGGIIGGLIAAGIMWIIAKILGGVGSYGAQLHMTSAPLAFILVLSGILSFIPIVGSIIALLLMIYYLYPLTIALREAHKFSTLKAVACWLLPIIIVGIIVVLLGVALLATLGAAGAAAGGYYR